MTEKAWVLTYDDCPEVRQLYQGWSDNSTILAPLRRVRKKRRERNPHRPEVDALTGNPIFGRYRLVMSSIAAWVPWLSKDCEGR